MLGKRFIGSDWPDLSHVIVPNNLPRGKSVPLGCSAWAFWSCSQGNLLISLTSPESEPPPRDSGWVNPSRTTCTNDSEGERDFPRALVSQKEIWKAPQNWSPLHWILTPFLLAPQDIFWNLGPDLKTMHLAAFYRSKNEGSERERAPPKSHSTPHHHPPSSWKVPSPRRWVCLLPVGSSASSLPGLAERICQLSACLSN